MCLHDIRVRGAKPFFWPGVANGSLMSRSCESSNVCFWILGNRKSKNAKPTPRHSLFVSICHLPKAAIEMTIMGRRCYRSSTSATTMRPMVVGALLFSLWTATMIRSCVMAQVRMWLPASMLRLRTMFASSPHPFSHDDRFFFFPCLDDNDSAITRSE
jgi:hypothetical protein